MKFITVGKAELDGIVSAACVGMLAVMLVALLVQHGCAEAATAQEPDPVSVCERCGRVIGFGDAGHECPGE